ncbi:alpha/beta fold hydrolase [Aestuariivita boseongensis]|uniref:alpha/beta fold hydrolase n=1 Tax=Aestuariivita boseongensis TaxID=1470562 RepID=UPI00068042C7|nr:alpha/beta hydrolase [Aestuariivita boseongensis]
MSTVTIILLVIVLLILLVTIITQFIGASAAAQSPRRGKMTKVTGGKIHWLDEGSGPPVVMIHGLGGNMHNFTYALNSELTDDFRVITIDRPGCGWSERDGIEQATLPEQARMIAEFIQAEDLGKPLVMGHSLGGAIAETLALNHPDQVGALALICPATDDVKQVPDAFKGIDIPKPWLIPVIGHTLSGALGILMEKKVLTQVFAPEPMLPDFVERGGGILARRPGNFIANAQDLTQSRNSVQQVLGREGELKLPIGVLFGGADNILDPVTHGKAFAEKTGGTFAELDGRGHMIPLTAPKECADFIRDVAKKMKKPRSKKG